MKRVIGILLFLAFFVSLYFLNSRNSTQAGLEIINKEIKIVSSSETTPYNGLENALDDIIGNYTEFYQKKLPCEFILKLGGERKIKRIEVNWDQKAYPETYSLYDTDFNGKVYSKIKQVETNSKKQQVIEFSEPVKSAFIKFSIPGNSKLDNLKLKSINIWSEPQTAIGKILMDESPTSKEAFLPSNSPLNPLRVWGQPISKSMKILADDILKGKGNLTTHQKVVEFMLYMNDFKVGNASENRPEVTIRERIGACGSFSNVLVALAATQGIPGRLISMANYPKNTGHAVVELLVNGRWQLYDPTYAAYYTTTTKDKENPYVLSFDELRAGMGKEKGISIIVGNQERLDKGKPYSLGFLGPDIYERANPAGVFGPDKPFIYPLSLDINIKTSLTREEFNTSYQGVSYIGAAGICNMQSWTLKGLIPGRSYCFNIVPDYLGGDVDKFKKFEAKAQILSGGVINSGEDCSYSVGQTTFDPWVIKFTATEPSVNILLSHNYRGPNFFYLEIKEFRLER